MKTEAIIVKRTFSGGNKTPITSIYQRSQKYVLFLNSDYYKAT